MAERILATTKAPETKQTCPNSCKQKRGLTFLGFTTDRILQLQRTAGNQAVQRLIKSRTLQAKLKISQPNDIYEQEAYKVAEQVMRMPDPILQRKCPKCYEDKEKVLQAKKSQEQMPVAQNQIAPSIVHEVLRSPGQPLDASTRAFFETRFGHDFSGVRVHTGHLAAESALAVNSLAYTVGRDVVFGARQYAPETSFRRKLVAHELAHVIQQRSEQMHIVIGPNPAENSSEKKNSSTNVQVMAIASQPPRVTTSRPQISRVSLGEMGSAVWGVGPWDTYKASKLADKALSKAQETGLPGIHNGPADAWRHCYWNCTMVADVGADQAETIANNHESYGGGPPNENTMDLHNNAQGRNCGGSNCDQCCQSLLEAGHLHVLDGARNVIPSSPTSRRKSPDAGSGAYYYSEDEKTPASKTSLIRESVFIS
jgi:hypothetical protein